MDEVTTKQPDTMRQLLARWAEVESGRCEKLQVDGFTVWTEAGAAKQVYNPYELSGVDLAWIQWAVQQAVIARGWAYSLDYIRSRPGYYVGVRTGGDIKSVGDSLDNPAEALLSAYLAALEASK